MMRTIIRLEKRSILLDSIVAFLFVCSMLLNEQIISNAIVIGTFLVILSFLNAVLVKDNKLLFVMFSIIFYINLSVFVIGFIGKGKIYNNYQLGIWSSSTTVIYSKCLLITNVVFYFVLCRNSGSKYLENNLAINNNSIISVLCVFVLCIIFLFSYNGSLSQSEGYVSNTNAFYEYAIFFFIICLIYSGNNRLIMTILAIILLAYVVRGVLNGDRSSFFPLLVFVVLFLNKTISAKKVIVFALIAIVFSSMISVFRSTKEITTVFDILKVVFSGVYRNLFSDTACYSCYSGLTIIKYSSIFSESKLQLFLYWVVSIVMGSSFIEGKNVEIVSLARRYYYNSGGGMFPAYFYFYGKYFGVMIASLVACILIKRIYKSKSFYANTMKYIIPSTVLRWYLYSPTTLFRSCFVNYSIIFYFFYVIYLMLRKISNYEKK